MRHTSYELDVRLREIEPPIWRTIEIAGAATLEELHFAIQVAMGWMNSHLHQFLIGDRSYGMADLDGAAELDIEDERRFRLQDLAKAGDVFGYEYDFGDSWEHDVTVAKVVVGKATQPRCTAGARACPPEDCGGMPGYAEMLSTGFRAEHFAIPKGGRELRREMDQLQALAEHGADDVSDPTLGIPRPLLEAVLALEPIKRAAVGGLIAQSLALQLEEAETSLDRLRKQAKPPRARKRT